MSTTKLNEDILDSVEDTSRSPYKLSSANVIGLIVLVFLTCIDNWDGMLADPFILGIVVTVVFVQLFICFFFSLIVYLIRKRTKYAGTYTLNFFIILFIVMELAALSAPQPPSYY